MSTLCQVHNLALSPVNVNRGTGLWSNILSISRASLRGLQGPGSNNQNANTGQHVRQWCWQFSRHYYSDSLLGASHQD